MDCSFEQKKGFANLKLGLIYFLNFYCPFKAKAKNSSYSIVRHSFKQKSLHLPNFSTVLTSEAEPRHVMRPGSEKK
jgi:hypothetical protein